jgi:hypothetical protein
MVYIYYRNLKFNRQYLNISRATFYNYIKQGKLQKGMKQQGFKELFWYKKDLDLYINSYEDNK